MEEYKQEPRTVKEIIEILSNMADQDAIVRNQDGDPIKIYAGRENKKNGKSIIMIC